MNNTQNIPTQQVKVKTTYLGLKEKKLVSGYWYGITSIPGRQFLCHVMLEDGSNWYGLPLKALLSHDTEQFVEYDFKDHYYQGYDCFSYDIQVIRFDFLRDQIATTLNGISHNGMYLFSVISQDKDGRSPFSEMPEQTKTFTFLQTDFGTFITMPNNYLAWEDKSLYNSKKNEYPKYKRISKITRSHR